MIEKKQGHIAKNRIKDYLETISSLKDAPPKKQLLVINAYLNRLLPQYDVVMDNKQDYWATPKEFLTCGFGDCEDYAIIKYYSLLKLGFDKKKLFVTTVREKFKGNFHMVLSYFRDDNASPLILDNLSFKILDLKTRTDLEAQKFINTTGVYKLSKDYKLIKIDEKSNNFLKLSIKVKNNH